MTRKNLLGKSLKPAIHLSLCLSTSICQLSSGANSAQSPEAKPTQQSSIARAAKTSMVDQAIELLKEYLQIDTSNPPGNEAKGAQYLAGIFKNNGIEAQVLETAPGRACTYARLKGNGKKKAVVLLNHIDVVPARAEDWQHPPFSGKVVDGEIWGRGTIDMKGIGIAQLAAMLEFKRSGKMLDRDLIFLATPDEEVGGKAGAEWFVTNHKELLKDAEFLLNEGAFIDTDDNGKARYCGVAVSEKSVLWLSLQTRGEAGHASMPLSDSSVNKLVKALDRIITNPPEPTVLPPVEEYFKRISSTVDEPLKSAYLKINESVKKPETFKILLEDKFKSSMLRSTISPTVLKAGYKTNVIPAESYAELDCRVLPGVSKDNFINRLKETIKDPSVQIGVLDWVHTDASAYDTACFDAIKKVIDKNIPGLPVVPMVMPWFTDSHWFRDLGIASYGFVPICIDQTHLATMHGKDERVPVEKYKQAVKIFYEVLDELCSSK